MLDRQQAEALYDSGKEETVAKLLEMDLQIQALRILFASLPRPANRAMPKDFIVDLHFELTPEPVRNYLKALERQIVLVEKANQELEKQIADLQPRLNQNSQNSSKPPSSDPPFKKPKKRSKPSNRKKGAQPGHEGHRQEMLPPTREETIAPPPCVCGCNEVEAAVQKIFHTHQQIELPEIKMDVLHLHLMQGTCASCGRIVKAELPKEFQPGYGPRLTALIAELSGIYGLSRHVVKNYCQSVLKFPISVGGIQQAINRASGALAPLYQQIGVKAHQSDINHVDETSWFLCGKLKWLWVMTNTLVSYFKIHPHRSKQAFLDLIEDWRGILVSDNYGVYVKWFKRQSCLAHYIRKARDLSERSCERASNFGHSILEQLQLLCSWAKAPPGDSEGTEFYEKFVTELFQHINDDGDIGKLARSLVRELDSLWLFLEENGVEPTNNRAERALRYAVMWRKRSNGTQSENGDRWVERILSVKETCRLRMTPTFPVLVDAVTNYFKDQKPDLTWI